MDVFRQACSVLLVFALLGAALWASRRRGKLSFQGFAGKRIRGLSRAMIAVERLGLTPQHTLHLVRMGGRELIVATHPQGCTLISEQAMNHPANRRAMEAEA
jgi:hypothetical protein